MNDWLEAEQRVERAQQLAESQQWDEALAELDAAIAINPNNAPWHAHRGFVLQQMDRSDQAASAFERAVELDPSDKDLLMALGTTRMALGRFAAALQVFDRVGQIDRDFEPAYCHRIAVYAELGRHEQAEEMFYLAQQLDDRCPHCFFHLGASLAMRAQYEQAIRCWRQTLTLQPEYPEVRTRIARAMRAQGQHDAARREYLAEYRNDAGNIELLVEMAEAAYEAGDPDAAITKLNQAIELEPDEPRAHLLLGGVCFETQKYTRALRCFQRALALDDRLPGIHNHIGRTLAQLGKLKPALRHLRVALREAPEDKALLACLASCYFNLDRFDLAATTYQKLLSIEGKLVAAHINLGICQYRLGQHEAGLKHCLRAAELDDKCADAMRFAALGHMQLGQWRSARQALRKAAELAPADPGIRRLRRKLIWYPLRSFLRRATRPFRRQA
ncbi:MAG: Lipopolysaccharide assembly protein B [Phycisphaerae bacterium]|nr:Lipopolysaccharide assembly protein B [Phycisphaerae bacterium]